MITKLMDFSPTKAVADFSNAMDYVVNAALAYAKVNEITVRDSKGGSKGIKLSEPIRVLVVPTAKVPTNTKAFMKIDSKDIINDSSVLHVYLGSETWIDATKDETASIVLLGTLVDQSLKLILAHHNVPYVTKDGKDNATLTKLHSAFGIVSEGRRSVKTTASKRLQEFCASDKMTKNLEIIRKALQPTMLEVSPKAAVEPKYKLTCDGVGCDFENLKAFKPFPKSEKAEVLEHFTTCGNDHNVSAVSVDDVDDVE